MSILYNHDIIFGAQTKYEGKKYTSQQYGLMFRCLLKTYEIFSHNIESRLDV